MNEREIITTPYFRLEIGPSMRWLELIRQKTNAYRIRYEINDVRYSIDITIRDRNGDTAENLAINKYAINENSAFVGENIPPHKLPNQKFGLTAWACRYRWVNGAAAPYRRHDLFMEVDDKIIQFSYLAKPDNFEQGFVEFIKIVNSVEPAN